MTPALKAMVEAMVAELNRQAEHGRPGPYVDDGVYEGGVDTEPDVNSILIDGRVDLEKVARAGLEAIPASDGALLAAMRDSVPVDGHEWEYLDAEAPAHWTSLIDAILKDQP